MSLNLFDFTDYRDYFKERISPQKHGRGQQSACAKILRLHPSFLSQVVANQKDLSLDQAMALATYWGLSIDDTEYWLELVALSRAATHELKTFHQQKLKKLKAEKLSLKKDFSAAKTLQPLDQAIFYSHWMYSAIRIMISIPEEKNNSPYTLSKKLNIPLTMVNQAIDFLLQSGLIQWSGDNLVITDKVTQIKNHSPSAFNHYRNWRLKALERVHLFGDTESMVTATVSISRKNAAAVNELIKKFTLEVKKLIDESHPEEFRCLNIDWIAPFMDSHHE